MPKGRRWAREEITFLEQNYGVMTLDNLAESMGRSVKSIIGKATYQKIESQHRTREKFSRELLCELITAGLSCKNIADRLGCNVTYVRYICRPLNEEMRKQLKDNGRTYNRDEMCQLISTGYTVAEIAEYWGCSSRSTQRISQSLSKEVRDQLKTNEENYYG